MQTLLTFLTSLLLLITSQILANTDNTIPNSIEHYFKVIGDEGQCITDFSHPFGFIFHKDANSIDVMVDNCKGKVASFNGIVRINRLNSDSNVKIFDSNNQVVFSCNPWEGNPCGEGEIVQNLIVGNTYFVSIQTSSCNEWVPVTIQSDGDSGEEICPVEMVSENGGVIITGLASDATAFLSGAGANLYICTPGVNPCTSYETVSDLNPGQTVSLEVRSNTCRRFLTEFIVSAPDNPNCGDLIQNQGETGVDCGGPCPPCTTQCNLTVTPTNGGVTITGLSSVENTKIFTLDYSQVVWSCNPWEGNPCTNLETVAGLTNGTPYRLVVNSGLCVRNIPFTPSGGGGCPDADGDGTCDADDCQPNNPALPATPGSSCNDFNSNTTNDVILSDGCTCQGTPIGGACNVNITASNGSVTITGLTSDANTKLFNSNTQSVWACNPWQGNSCSGTETVSGLTNGATYFLSVQSNVCSEWIPVTVSGGGGGGNGPDLVLSSNSSSIGFGAPGQVLNFTFNLINQGSSTASGSYFIRSYISTDQSLSNDDIQEGVIATGNTPVGNTAVNGAITIPNNLADGVYSLILKVDDDNDITESNENNNIFTDLYFSVNSGGGNGCNNVINVAQGKPATQSSTLNFGGINSGAAKAVDGNTNGNYFNGSVAATNAESEAWWQVDLGSNHDVTSIKVYNRNDGADRLNNFYILTSTSPFTSNSLANARNQADSEKYFAGTAGLPTNWDFPGGDVRYVRVQRASYGYATIAEVQVMGCAVGMADDVIQSFETPSAVVTPNFAIKNIFPNPTSGEVISQIESSFDGTISMQVVNILGQSKLKKNILVEQGMNIMSWDFNHLDNGIYHIIFHDGKKMVTKKLVISK